MLFPLPFALGCASVPPRLFYRTFYHKHVFSKKCAKPAANLSTGGAYPLVFFLLYGKIPPKIAETGEGFRVKTFTIDRTFKDTKQWQNAQNVTKTTRKR